MQAEARLSSATNSSQAQIQVAKAEGYAQQYFEPKRKHEEAMAQTNALIRMGKNVAMVVSGKNGAGILDFFKNAFNP